MDYNFSKEQAIFLHRQMWEEMKEKLGDNPSNSERVNFKDLWCEAHGYGGISNSCFLCAYDDQFACGDCSFCPIDWSSITEDGFGKGRCYGNYINDCNGVAWSDAPISEILNLPEKRSLWN